MRLASLAGAAAIAAGAACSDSPPATADPAATALRLFELATTSEPAWPELEALVGPLRDERQRAAIAAALAGLADAREPRVVRIAPLLDGERVAVDVIAGLPGGGETTAWLVVERAAPEDRWRILSFHAPGGEWPARRSAGGEGLSTSPPPEPSRPPSLLESG
jgi:hypothetical protein